MKKSLRIFFFLLGLAGLALLIYKTDPAHIDWSSLFTPRILLILLIQFALWAVIFYLHIKVYKQILGEESYKKIGILRLFRITVSGFALNNVTPAGLVGGEPFRIMELRPFCGTKKAVSATLTFTVFYTMGHMMLWSIGSAMYFILGCPGTLFFTVMLAIAFCLMTLGSILFIRSKKQGFIMPVLRFFAGWPLLGKPVQKLIDKHGEQYSLIDEEISAFSRDRKRFFNALILELVSRLLEAAEYYVILRMLGASVTYPGGLLTMSFASLVGNIFFIIPMQASTREGGMALALSWLAVSDGIQVMTGLLYRVRELLCIALGIGFILVEKRSKGRQSVPETMEEITQLEKEENDGADTSSV